MAGSDPGFGGLSGTNDLQASIDQFDQAVSQLISVVANMSSAHGGSPGGGSVFGGWLVSVDYQPRERQP